MEGRPRPTPAPSFVRGDSSRADLLAYAHSLQFDTTRPAMAAQYLVVPRAGQLVVGPFAKLAPEIGSGSITRAALESGRILARITLSAPCPQAGLPQGDTYVWIDSTGSSLRAVLIPEAASAPLLHLPVRSGVLPAGGPDWVKGAAWLDTGTDSLLMMGLCHWCDTGWCCTQAMMIDPLGGDRNLRLNPDTVLGAVKRPGVRVPARPRP